MEEWLLCFCCSSLSPSLLTGLWDVEYVSVALFCYILDAVLCYVWKKKNVDNKKRSGLWRALSRSGLWLGGSRDRQACHMNRRRACHTNCQRACHTNCQRAWMSREWRRAWDCRERRWAWDCRGRRASEGRERRRWFPRGRRRPWLRRGRRTEDEGGALEDTGAFGVGQAVWAVGEVCGGFRRGLSWGDAARSSWSGDDEAEEFPRPLRQNRSERGLG